MAEGRLVGADRIGLRVGKLIDRYKMAKHKREGDTMDRVINAMTRLTPSV